jgi:hypothetical protein
MALQWAQENGFRIAATEVSLPNRGVRMDVAAYRPQRIKKQKGNRMISCAAIGVTAIFECKVSTPDFRRDARSIIATTERLQILHAKKLKIEDELKIFYPSIRNGDSLFQEFETLNFERPGYERYEKVIGEIRQLSSRLHENTKFDQLTKYGSANLYYLVADADVLAPHKLPADWGWLKPNGDELELVMKPIWHDVDEDQRLEFLHRIAMTATRAGHRQLDGILSDTSPPTSTCRKPF